MKRQDSLTMWLIDVITVLPLLITATYTVATLHYSHSQGCRYFTCTHSAKLTAGVSNLASNLGQIGPKWDPSGNFKDLFQYILAQMLNLTSLVTVEKLSGRAARFDLNLTQIHTKSNKSGTFKKDQSDCWKKYNDLFKKSQELSHLIQQIGPI